MMLLGVDTGGTFTDFVLFDTDSAGTNLRVHKVLSTPKAPERAILQGIEELGLVDCEGLLLVHGSTVATNAVLEGKGVRTAFITNTGLRDLLTIGRQARRELYHLNPRPVAQLPQAGEQGIALVVEVLGAGDENRLYHGTDTATKRGRKRNKSKGQGPNADLKFVVWSIAT